MVSGWREEESVVEGSACRRRMVFAFSFFSLLVQISKRRASQHSKTQSARCCRCGLSLPKDSARRVAFFFFFQRRPSFRSTSLFFFAHATPACPLATPASLHTRTHHARRPPGRRAGRAGCERGRAAVAAAAQVQKHDVRAVQHDDGKRGKGLCYTCERWREMWPLAGAARRRKIERDFARARGASARRLAPLRPPRLRLEGQDCTCARQRAAGRAVEGRGRFAASNSAANSLFARDARGARRGFRALRPGLT